LQQAFDKSASGLRFHKFAMVPSRVYLCSNKYFQPIWRSRIKQQKFLLWNRFHVALHIVRPEIYKHAYS